VTRELGSAWLWLQLVTTGFFAWGVFIGMATATRRIDHLNLVEITRIDRKPHDRLAGRIDHARVRLSEFP
jgi:TRAP-type C4-dicarboxylate transport system permease small subunit